MERKSVRHSWTDTSANDPSYRESTTPPSEDEAELSLYQDFSEPSTPTTPPSGFVPNQTLSPEFLPLNKSLILKPAVKLAESNPPLPPRRPAAACAYPDPPKKPGSPSSAITPSPYGDYIYYDIPADFGKDFREKCPTLPPTPKPPLFRAPKLGSLFTRETRSKTTLPSSVLHQYPTERKQKK